MNIKHRRLLLFKSAAVVLSLAVALFLLEASLRVLGPGDSKRFVPDESVYFSNPRHYFQKLSEQDGQDVYGIIYKQDPVSFIRIPETAAPAPRALKKDAPRILILGDSFAFGVGVWYKDIFSHGLEKMLAAKDYDYEVVNTGMIGADIELIHYLYGKYTASAFYPIVLYAFVLNDFGIPDKIVGSDFIDMDNGGARYDKWRGRFALYDWIRARIENRRLTRRTTQAYLRSFSGPRTGPKLALLKSMAQDARARGGRFAVVLFPLLHDFNHYPFGQIHDRLRSFCEKENIPFLDLLPAFSKFRAEDLWVHPVDHHPNEAGHAIAAKEIFDFLTRRGWLCRDPRP